MPFVSCRGCSLMHGVKDVGTAAIPSPLVVVLGYSFALLIAVQSRHTFHGLMDTRGGRNDSVMGMSGLCSTCCVQTCSRDAKEKREKLDNSPTLLLAAQ